MILSIIVPVYNRKSQISRCIDSLIAIKNRNIEIILVNDGSTDNSLEICKSYLPKDSRIHVIDQENKGVSGARNTGIENSHGKFLAFVDADDEVTKEYDQIIQVLEEKEGYDLYSFDYFRQDADEVQRGYSKFPQWKENEKASIYRNYLKGVLNNVWSNIYVTRIIKDNNIRFPIEMKMGEDSVFNSRYFMHCENAYYIDAVAYRYYTDDNSSASYAGKLSYLADFVKVYENYLKIYNSFSGLNYPNCTKYHVDNIYFILKRYRKEMSKEEKKAFRRSLFCKNLLSQNYRSWKYEIKKGYIFVCLYLVSAD